MLYNKYEYLKPYEYDINLRIENYKKKLNEMKKNNQKLSDKVNSYLYYGFHKTYNSWIYREWAPAADALYLTGDFNNWHWLDNPMKRIDNGNWELQLPLNILSNGSKVMTIVKNGDKLTQHIPLYAKRVVQDANTKSWCCEVWDNPDGYTWKNETVETNEPPIIYEAHIGMSSEEYKIASYREFADNVLPHIKDNGYNTIQLMGIMEHPYYGSAGYQVSNYYAASSRYGYPEELKYLIDKAHGMGIRVILDVIHSHAVGNTLEGINRFDGTDYQFFHEGERGNHPTWGTKCFNYSKNEVLWFLLGNLKFWMEEYRFDGFRFDGVTSMLYINHALGESFVDLKQYFSMNTDTDAVTYLQLANKLVKEINPNAVTIAEDMSGMPGLCEPIQTGGIGFDYRLGMGLPDMWIKLIKEQPDCYWNVGHIWYELTNRNAKTISYAESHDQALVGDKTLIFRLADAEMYTGMSKDNHSPTIDRALALHKLIRIITLTAGGNGYLNFMGNEFGHPEWIDFPSVQNNDSFHYCRRQWSLLQNDNLKYRYLNNFDRDMINISINYDIYKQNKPKLMKIHESDSVLAYERYGLVFVYNFHPTDAYTDYVIPVKKGCDYQVIMTSDDEKYGGFGRIEKGRHSAFTPGQRGNKIRLYLPPETCTVLVPLEI